MKHSAPVSRIAALCAAGLLGTALLVPCAQAQKKGGTLTLKLTVNPLDSGAVQIVADVTSKPVKDPAGTIFFADGDGSLSRDNAGLFYSK